MQGGFLKWILIAVGALIAWRFLNGWLNSSTGYTVQSSNYVGPTYQNTGYGYAGPQYGVIGAWPIPGSGWDSNYGGGGDGWGGHHHHIQQGLPNGSARW